MAPANYKRPNAILTPKMVENAERELENLGLKDSLGRRFANTDDVSAANLLFVNRDTKKLTGIFEELKDVVTINPKTLSNVKEYSIKDFLTDVLPNIDQIEVLFENSHGGNLVSLIAPKYADAPTLFKWDNAFSWSYRNAMADSLKEKVKAAGGKVTGELRASLEWFNYDDLDLHIIEPDGNEIYFGRALSERSGGNLDVDMNAGDGTTRKPVENIIFPDKSKMLEGEYKVLVQNFVKRESIDFGFNVEIECADSIFTFSRSEPLADKCTVVVAEFTYDRKNGITMKTKSDSVSASVSNNVWGLDTNKFHKVSMIIKSPNYWGDNNIGNSHLFFMIPGMKNNETVRGFFNEFLRTDLLEQHKRVFEALGSRMKVGYDDNQLSGLGFSSTGGGHLICNLTGNYKRKIKIKF